MMIKSIRSALKTLGLIAVACASSGAPVSASSISTGAPRQVTLIDCYLSGKRVGVSEFSNAAGIWYGRYENLARVDVAIPDLLGFMADSSAKFLEFNKDVTRLEYLVNLSTLDEMRAMVERGFVRAAKSDNTPVGDFITRKEKIKDILEEAFNSIEAYKTWKQECRNRGLNLEPAVGEVKFRRDDVSKGTLFSPTCGVVVTRPRR